MIFIVMTFKYIEPGLNYFPRFPLILMINANPVSRHALTKLINILEVPWPRMEILAAMISAQETSMVPRKKKKTVAAAAHCVLQKTSRSYSGSLIIYCKESIESDLDLILIQDSGWSQVRK